MAIACNTEILAHFVKNCEGQADLRRWGSGNWSAADSMLIRGGSE
jgi:hypothetical protein